MNRLAKARQAAEAQDWATVFEQFSELDDPTSLRAEDLEVLAQAAWWQGRIDVAIDAHERAYRGFFKSGKIDAAVMNSLYLFYDYMNQGDFAVGMAWQARAARLAKKVPGSPAEGFVGIVACGAAYGEGDFESCLRTAKHVMELGEKHQDPTLMAWGLHWEGLCLIKRGQLDEGWTRLDEAMLEVSMKQMHPIWAGFLYCNTIQICEELGDPRRGWQWVETTERWLSSNPPGPIFPGICRMFKVRLLQERGVWDDAEAEASRLSEELPTRHVRTAARGHYEVGEIKRLRGDLAGAEELFAKAHQMGFDPQPGLALLRHAQGKLDAAAELIERALDAAPDRLNRAKFLPAVVEISLARKDEARAFEAVEELAATATAYRSPGLNAAARTARGALFMFRTETEDALAELREAVRRWSELDCPYEEGFARVRAAEALRALGNEDGARMELEAARELFARLGSVAEVQRTERLLGQSGHPGGLSDREVEVLELVAAGRTNKEIAGELFISEHTVARHLSNIFLKLGITSRAAATAYALKRGIG